MENETTKITVFDIEFDGDTDGLEFIKKLNVYEVDTIRKYFVYQKDFYFYDGKEYRYRIYLRDNVYIIEKAR